MRNLNDGEKHAICDMCDSWLMTILEISGGISNIPMEKKLYFREIQSICVSEFYKYLENNEINPSMPDFWHFWETNHPEFYDFESYMIYNPDPEKARKAVKRAEEHFPR